MGDHRRLTDRQVKRLYNSQAWRQTRLMVLARDHHRCCDCGGLAWTVHHIKPLRAHPELALRAENLRTMCHACHGKEDGKRGTPAQVARKKPNRFMTTVCKRATPGGPEGC